jgi:hypothetical protein
MPRPAVTDEQIGLAISRGVDFLLAQFDEQGQLKKPMEPDAERAKTMGPNDRSMQAGHQVLCIYAVLAAGQAIRDERLNLKGKTIPRLIDAMKQANITGHAETYARGIRATALALNNRPEDREALAADVRYLLANVHGGAYTYGQSPYASSTIPEEYQKTPF